MPRSTIERIWEAHGLCCAVLRMDVGHRCGYCQVPDDHPWKGLSYSDVAPEAEAAKYDEKTLDDIGMGGMIALLGGPEEVDKWARRIEAQVDVHGGLTYGGEAPGALEGKGGWWFGFDCAHAGDWSSWEPDGIPWETDEVAREVERMAAQIAAKGKIGSTDGGDDGAQ